LTNVLSVCYNDLIGLRFQPVYGGPDPGEHEAVRGLVGGGGWSGSGHAGARRRGRSATGKTIVDIFQPRLYASGRAGGVRGNGGPQCQRN